MKLASNSPLQFTDTALLHRFCSRFGITAGADNQLGALCAAFSRIPFENLTKIIKSDTVVTAEQKKRLPHEVIRSYLDHGTGGTCFSLNSAFISLLSLFGYNAWPLLCDRSYGADTHCAVLLVQNNKQFIIDPGYLIFRPLAVPQTVSVMINNGFNDLELAPQHDTTRIDLTSLINNQRRYRLTYKVDLIDESTFFNAWERSFTFDMMHYPVVTFCSESTHYYLQGSILRIRTSEGVSKQMLTPRQQHDFIVSTTGIHRSVFDRVFQTVSYGANTSSFAR
jgi:arylamine N-acetyltransferase